MLRNKPKNWNNYDWVKYRHAIRVLEDQNAKPPPFTHGKTARENWESEWRDNLDSYVDRVKYEFRKQ